MTARWNPTISFPIDDTPVSMTLTELEQWNWWKGWKPPALEGWVPHDGPAETWVWIRGRRHPLEWTDAEPAPRYTGTDLASLPEVR